MNTNWRSMEDIDINLLVQTFSEKITQLINECVIKDTMIKQLSSRIDGLEKEKNLGEQND